MILNEVFTKYPEFSNLNWEYEIDIKKIPKIMGISILNSKKCNWDLEILCKIKINGQFVFKISKIEVEI